MEQNNMDVFLILHLISVIIIPSRLLSDFLITVWPIVTCPID